MNLTHLNTVFEHYIEKFEWLNKKPEPDESYKWVAVKNFQSVLNLDVTDSDFPEMLSKACKATENLIDSNHQQPFRALCEYAKTEPATVRFMLKELFADDSGDLSKRQEKIAVFLSRADELLKKYFPTSHLFINTQRSAMAYLWFYNPNEYYYYKATEAKYLADCVEFYDDWGTNNNFDLSIYHRFCDEIVSHIKDHSSLIETHQSRFIDCEDKMHLDEQLHILIVDLIFCAKRYGLYNGIPIKDSSAPAKRLYQERKAKAAELSEAVAAAEKNVILLEEAKKAFLKMLNSGAEITLKSFGKAKFIGLFDQSISLFLEETKTQKKFDFFFLLTNKQIIIDSPDFDMLLEKYRSVLKSEKTIRNRLDTALKELEPYAGYLD